MLLSITISSYSQQTLKGTVSNFNTFTPIAGASIYFPILEIGVATDEKGVFEFSNLPVGNYELIVSSMGFENFTMTISLPHEKILEIHLVPSVIEMDEIILSTPFHKLQGENVVKVEQLKLSSMNRKGSINLSSGISSVPGVASISTGSSIGKPVIRGLSSNRILVYTQGVRLENQQFGDEHGLGLSESGIESVEVIKGPASLLYGSDALGGVLYFNPERFASMNSSAFDAKVDYYSNTQGIITSAGYKASSEKVKFIARASTSEHADYKTSDYNVTNTRFKAYDFKSALGFQDTNFLTEIRYNFNNSTLGIPEEIGVQNSSKTPLFPNQKIGTHILSSKTKWFLPHSSLELNAGYTHNDRKEFEEPAEAELHMKLKTFNYDLKYSVPQMGSFETIIGLQGMNQRNSNFGEETLIPNARTADIGVLGTSHVHFENTSLQLGLRVDSRQIRIEDSETKNFESFNGAIGFKTNLSEALDLRLNMASGFRAPNLAELTANGTHEGANRYEIGNINLDHERNFQLDLALEFKSDHWEFYLNGFYNNVSDYIFLQPNGDVIDTAPVYLYTQENAVLKGGEFGIHFHPHPYDWLHIESDFETVSAEQENGNYLPLIPANKWSNTIRAEFETTKIKNSYAFFTVQSTFSQNRFSEFETKTAGYTLLNAGFGGEFMWLKQHFKTHVSLTNITNKNYINHLSRLKPDGIYNQGRSINLGFSVDL